MIDTVDNKHIQGHVLIRDKHTQEVLVDKRNSIHYGNLARVVAEALINQQGSYIHYMAFGNGATSVDTAGKVIYKTPRVSESYETGASLYNRTYQKIVSAQAATNRIDLLQGPSYTDLRVTCTLSFGEPADQDLFDTSGTSEGDYIFDELALFGFPADQAVEDPINTSLMLTHVVFHPVQKSLNREIEVIYTVRIQLS